MELSTLNIFNDSKHCILGLAGKSGMGKTTVANRLLAELNNAVIISFADPIKEYAKKLGWNGEKDDSGRRLLQLLGTECGRECIDQNIWLKSWFYRYICIVLSNKNSIIIVDDVRFDNEVELIEQLGGTVVKLTGRVTEHLEHKSENDLQGLITIDNSNDINDTVNNIIVLMEDIYSICLK